MSVLFSMETEPTPKASQRLLDPNTLGNSHAPLAASCREVPARLFILIQTSGKSDSKSTSSDHCGASLARTPGIDYNLVEKVPIWSPGQ